MTSRGRSVLHNNLPYEIALRGPGDFFTLLEQGRVGYSLDYTGPQGCLWRSLLVYDLNGSCFDLSMEVTGPSGDYVHERVVGATSQESHFLPHFQHLQKSWRQLDVLLLSILWADYRYYPKVPAKRLQADALMHLIKYRDEALDMLPMDRLFSKAT
jgi:hypothetical protein